MIWRALTFFEGSEPEPRNQDVRQFPLPFSRMTGEGSAGSKSKIWYWISAGTAAAMVRVLPLATLRIAPGSGESVTLPGTVRLRSIRYSWLPGRTRRAFFDRIRSMVHFNPPVSDGDAWSPGKAETVYLALSTDASGLTAAAGPEECAGSAAGA